MHTVRTRPRARCPKTRNNYDVAGRTAAAERENTWSLSPSHGWVMDGSSVKFTTAIHADADSAIHADADSAIHADADDPAPLKVCLP